MKRVFFMLLVMMFVLPNLAFAITNSKLSQPQAPIYDALVGAEICSYKLLTITVTDAKFTYSKYSDESKLTLDVVIKNDNDFHYEGWLVKSVVNDWEVDDYSWFEIDGGHKRATDLVLKLKGTGIRSLDEIESVSLTFKLAYAYLSGLSDTVTIEAVK